MIGALILVPFDGFEQLSNETKGLQLQFGAQKEYKIGDSYQIICIQPDYISAAQNCNYFIPSIGRQSLFCPYSLPLQICQW